MALHNRINMIKETVGNRIQRSTKVTILLILEAANRAKKSSRMDGIVAAGIPYVIT